MNRRPIHLASPDITEADRRAVMEVLEGTTLALGPKIRAFEERAAEAAGVGHAVAMNSGTSALHTIIRALEIGPGDEIVTTPFSFMASTNCLLFEGATPVFADIDPSTLCLDPAKAREAITPRTRGILAVDVFGHPADWAALESLAQERDLLLIEDSAEAIGSKLGGRRCGGFGRAGVFAFYPNKQITTGEGGMVVTDDANLAEHCRSLANQGRGDGGWLDHVRLGYNYRMDEMSAALGLSQLARLDEIVERRGRVASWYGEMLDGIGGIRTPQVAPDVEISWFVYVVTLCEEFSRQDRDEILRGLRADDIGCRDYFQPIHLQSYIQEKLGTRPGQFPVAESVSARTIALPFFTSMSRAQVEDVAAALGRLMRG